MRIFLANDTSGQGHAGSDAAIRSILYRLRFHEVIRHPSGSLGSLEAIRDCDAVVLNGEGTIHHNTDGAAVAMHILRVAQMASKPAYLINATYQVYDARWKSLLRELAGLQVREPMSAKFAREHGGKPQIRMDSALDPDFKYSFEPSRAGILLGANDRDSEFAQLIEKLPGFKRFTAWNVRDFDELVKVISGATLYVTGQWHGICAAIIARTPFIAIPSNSHKIESFLDWFGLPIPVMRSAADFPFLKEFVLDNASLYESFFDRVHAMRDMVFKAEDLLEI